MSGRPKLKIDAETVEKLAAFGLNAKEISVFLDCSEDTITRRFKKRLENGWARMHASLKRTQYDVAVNKKNATMLIWLGKQHLGQSDTAGNRVQGPGDQLDGLYKALMSGPAAKPIAGQPGSDLGSGSGSEGVSQSVDSVEVTEPKQEASADGAEPDPV